MLNMYGPFFLETSFIEVKFDIFGKVNGWVFNDANENEVKVSVFILSTKKLKDLGFNFQPIEGVIHEIITNFKECWCLP
jgi:hypothetical protein